MPNKSHRKGVAVTPSDTTIYACEGLWVGGAGNLVVDFSDTGTGVTLSGVPAGTYLPISALRIKAATTATLIVALY